MRSIRCYIATKWIQLCAEFEEMGWSSRPLNPLQHVQPGVTRDIYADKQATDVHKARQRCIEKYGDEARKHFAMKDAIAAQGKKQYFKKKSTILDK